MDAMAPEGARCAEHAGRAAVGVCVRCGDFVCGHCAQPRAEGMYCARCAPALLIRSTPGARIAAHLIDSIATGLVLVLLAVPSFADAPVGIMMIALLLLVGYLVFQAVLVHRHGQSLGKRIMEIRMATLDGRAAGLARVALLRNLLPGLIQQVPLVGWVYAVTNLVMLFLEGHRCVHDHIAGTIVVDAPRRSAATFQDIPR